MRRLIHLIAAVPILFAAAGALAVEYGTPAEAEAMLDRAVVEMKTDADAAIAKFNDPNGGFRDRDLYVFCATIADGKIVAHPSIVGTDLRTLSDKNGKPFGAEMLDGAAEGVFTEVTYMWPRPDSTEPVDKVSRVTRIGDQICGVGYYKE
jgi:signal transduction histidine kinase